MSFLSIPSQGDLFTTVKNSRSTEEGKCNPVDDDEEEDDDPDDIRFIPRCSPVPRKRGQSIYDETVEYLQLHSTLPVVARRVAFADTTGGDLVHVKEFVAFDSDEEDDGRWELEESRYRKPTQEPTYHVSLEYIPPTYSVLTRALHANKVEVEQLGAVEGEPLAFSGIIRVLNISFHKSVYIRSTMDSWSTYFDFPADYVQGSNDGETDAFSFKLSFAPPYLTHGSRIEFVVRYETSDGDYWANNSQMNYGVTLLLSYEEATSQATAMREIRGILKAPTVYSMEDDLDFDSNEEDEELQIPKPTLVRPTPVTLVMPEIDIEAENRPPCLLFAPNSDQLPSDGILSPTVTSENNHKDSSFASQAEPLPKPHCELGNQTPERFGDGSPSALPSTLHPFPSVCSISVGTVGSEQSRETPTLDDPEPDGVTHPPVAEIRANTALDEADPPTPHPTTVIPREPSPCCVSPEITWEETTGQEDQASQQEEPKAQESLDDAGAQGLENRLDLPAETGPKSDPPEAGGAETPGLRSDRPEAGGEETPGLRSDHPEAGGEETPGLRSDHPEAGGAETPGLRSDHPEAGGEETPGLRSDHPEAGGEETPGLRSDHPEAGGEETPGLKSDHPEAGGEETPGLRSDHPEAGGAETPGLRSGRPEAGGEETPGPLASCAQSPHTVARIGPTPGEDGVSHGLGGHPPAEPPSYSVSSAPEASHGLAGHPPAEPPSYSVSSAPEASHGLAGHPPAEPPSVSSAPVASQATWFQRDVWRNVIPSIIFLCGAIFFSIALQRGYFS